MAVRTYRGTQYRINDAWGPVELYNGILDRNDGLTYTLTAGADTHVWSGARVAGTPVESDSPVVAGHWIIESTGGSAVVRVSQSYDPTLTSLSADHFTWHDQATVTVSGRVAVALAPDNLTGERLGEDSGLLLRLEVLSGSVDVDAVYLQLEPVGGMQQIVGWHWHDEPPGEQEVVAQEKSAPGSSHKASAYGPAPETAYDRAWTALQTAPTLTDVSGIAWIGQTSLWGGLDPETKYFTELSLQTQLYGVNTSEPAPFYPPAMIDRMTGDAFIEGVDWLGFEYVADDHDTSLIGWHVTGWLQFPASEKPFIGGDPVTLTLGPHVLASLTPSGYGDHVAPYDHRLATTVLELTAAIEDTRRAALAAGTVGFFRSNGIVQPWGVYRVPAWRYQEPDWGPSPDAVTTTTPPLRLRQRNDGLASGPAHLRGPSSFQSGRRLRGYY